MCEGDSVIAGVARLVVFLLDTAVVIPLTMLASLADREAKLAYLVARTWAWLNFRLCGGRLVVEGLENLEPGKSYVFMSNHRSNLDVLAIVGALWGRQLRWVAKRELFRIPFFGWALRATKQILVDRADHHQAVASLALAKQRMKDGISVVFFPEGTRSAGPMLPFKKGGFVFAIETGVPIVPIGIAGTAPILPRNGWLVRHGGEVLVVVGAPIPTATLGLDDREALLGRVERAITAAVEQAARGTPDAPSRLGTPAASAAAGIRGQGSDAGSQPTAAAVASRIAR